MVTRDTRVSQNRPRFCVRTADPYIKTLSFTDSGDYKSEDEFKKILKDYVTLETVKMAVKRANAIREDNYKLGRKKITKHGFVFYKDNPDTTVHSVVSKIFEICGIDY